LAFLPEQNMLLIIKQIGSYAIDLYIFKLINTFIAY